MRKHTLPYWFVNSVNHHALLSVALLCGIFTSCVKDVDLELDDKGGKTVLYAFLQPDSALVVSLSRSVSILSGAHYDYFSNATMSIYRNGDLYRRMAYPNNQLSATWEGVTFSVGDRVQVVVESTEGETANGQTVIPDRVPINQLDTLRVLKKGSDGVYRYSIKTKVIFNDPVGTNDFYQLTLTHKKIVKMAEGELSETLDTINFVKDDKVFYNSEQGVSSFESIDFQGLFNDESIKTEPYSLVIYLPTELFDKSPNTVTNQLIFKLHHLDAVYYSFLRARILAASYEGLPIFNAVRVPSNVANGFGVITSLATDVDTLNIDTPQP